MGGLVEQGFQRRSRAPARALAADEQLGQPQLLLPHRRGVLLGVAVGAAVRVAGGLLGSSNGPIMSLGGVFG